MNLFMVMEALSSVSLSHEAGCQCPTCRAALGEPGAMAEAFAALSTEADSRPTPTPDRDE